MMASEWREELLSGIESIHRIGTPGTLVVYGGNAQPILCGRDPEDVIVAAAELGEGRMVVFSHGGYPNALTHNNEEYTALMNNIKMWVTKGKWKAEGKGKGNLVEAQHVKDFAKLDKDRTVVIWCDNAKTRTEAFLNGIEQFVTGGGALVCGSTPWGWEQVTGMSLNDHPMQVLLNKVGIFFTGNYSSSYAEIAADVTKGARAHFGNNIRDTSPEAFVENAKFLIESVRSLPESALRAIMDDVSTMYESFKDDFPHIPDKKTPVDSEEGKLLVCLYSILLSAGMKGPKGPSVKYFPGDFASSPQLMCVEVEIQAHVKDFHATGFYVPAGQILKVTVKDENLVEGWRVRVGAHTDRLHGVTGAWRRWPEISDWKSINNGDTIMKSAFGGLVYFESPGGRCSLKAKLSDVVEAPYYDLMDPATRSKWSERKEAPGLWADLSGEFVTITLPREAVTDIDDPAPVLKFWDRVMRAHHHLRGTDIRKWRRQFVIADEQPSAGYMHAGYPVVTHMDVADPKSTDRFLLNLPRLEDKGDWGMFHELGHNMQSPMWTFHGTGEVTCNIFTLHAMDVVCNRDPWIHCWLAEHVPAMKSYLESDTDDFQQWREQCCMALGIYAQLINSFGWAAYKKVFRRYEEEKPQLDDQGKIDTWVRWFSEAVNCNLCPQFELWKWPISNEVKEALKDLPLYLSEDEITQDAATQTQSILETHPGCVRECCLVDFPCSNELGDPELKYPTLCICCLSKTEGKHCGENTKASVERERDTYSAEEVANA